MENFKKPERIEINAIPYFNKLLRNGIIKDLQDGEQICPVCQGTGLALDDQIYGLSNDPDKTVGHFPYHKQYIASCQNCYGGVIKTCRHCGEPFDRKRYQCECDGAKAERILKKDQAEAEKYEKSDKLNYDDDIVLAMDMLYSEDYTDNEGYFSDWEDFFENWNDHHDPSDERPVYVWGTEALQFTLDADRLIENGLEDHYEDAGDQIDHADRKELQETLDDWCRMSADFKTFYQTVKYSVSIPWELNS